MYYGHSDQCIVGKLYNKPQNNIFDVNLGHFLILSVFGAVYLHVYLTRPPDVLSVKNVLIDEQSRFKSGYAKLLYFSNRL